MTDAERNRMVAIGLCESIAQGLWEMEQSRWSDAEYADLCRTLREIEDRVFRKGEYAPENIARLPPLPLAVVTHMKKVSR